MTCVISPEGEMYFETYLEGTTAERYRSFIENLNEPDESTKFVIHDDLPSHRARLVKQYAESRQGKLKLFQLLGYNLELNPDEWMWKNLKKRLGRRAYKSLEDLTEHATKIMCEIKQTFNCLRAFMIMPTTTKESVKSLRENLDSSSHSVL